MRWSQKSSKALPATRVGARFHATLRVQPAPSLAHRGHIGWNYLYVSQRKDKNVLKARIKEITDTRVHYDYRIYLLRYDTARDSLKEIIEGRDEDYATITRSLVTNVTVSGRCARCIPASSATKTWPSA